MVIHGLVGCATVRTGLHVKTQKPRLHLLLALSLESWILQPDLIIPSGHGSPCVAGVVGPVNKIIGGLLGITKKGGEGVGEVRHLVLCYCRRQGLRVPRPPSKDGPNLIAV